MLSNTELSRYQKHLFLPEIGANGQEKLKAAKVLVVGAGGLGCSVLQYLSAAGIGKIGIVDCDKVELSNLQRQVLYSIADIGLSKAETASKHLKETNDHVDYQVFDVFLIAENAFDIIENYDIVVDCTDNFTVRYLINDVCVSQNKPFVYGAIHKFEGQVAVFNFTSKEGFLGPTYRCVFPIQPSESEIPNCATVGVLGVLPGIVGMYQANEVVKMILGIGKVLSGEMLLVDLLENSTNKIKIKRREVVENRLETKDKRLDSVDLRHAETGKIQDIKDNSEKLLDVRSVEISATELNIRILAGEDIDLIDVRNEFEFNICCLPNSQLIPLNVIENKVSLIATDKPVVIICHHGMRSAHAIKVLQSLGSFKNLLNLTGGIDAWALEIDENMHRY